MYDEQEVLTWNLIQEEEEEELMDKTDRTGWRRRASCP